MSWYNNHNEGFIDATQELQSGGASQVELDEINDDITEINEVLDELKEVFKPKVLDEENASLDTIIVNNTANSRIFIKNSNTTPKVKINDVMLNMKQDVNVPEYWQGKYWASASGWQSLEVDGLLLNVYVYAKDDWQTLRENKKIALNSRYFNEKLNTFELPSILDEKHSFIFLKL